MIMPPGKFFTMFHFLEYPFSRGSTHITSANPYEAPDFDAGFMNDKRDMAPMVWGYVKSRETARRMDSYAGEVQSMHPFYAFDSPARALDMDLQTTNAYALPGTTVHCMMCMRALLTPLTRQRHRRYPARKLDNAAHKGQSRRAQHPQLQRPRRTRRSRIQQARHRPHHRMDKAYVPSLPLPFHSH
jgi:hypothetical protein